MATEVVSAKLQETSLLPTGNAPTVPQGRHKRKLDEIDAEDRATIEGKSKGNNGSMTYKSQDYMISDLIDERHGDIPYPHAECQREEKDRWPARSLFFKTWGSDGGNAFDIVIEILTARGWKYRGEPCHPCRMKDLALAAKGELKGKYKLPRKCLWFVDEHDAKYLKELDPGPEPGMKNMISAYPGTEPATYKTSWSKTMSGQSFYPISFICPQQRNLLLEFMKNFDGTSYWICKPRNDYGGEGMTVYASTDELYQKAIQAEKCKQFVVQRYIGNPLLIGGYKFHCRIYMIVTQMRPKLKAFVYNDGHALFSTREYKVGDSNLGVKNFDPFMHLTNLHINCVEENVEHILKDKPVLGTGCEWTVKTLLTYLEKTYPGYTAAKFWKETLEICTKTIKTIAYYPTVKKMKICQEQHFQFFGIDILFDDQLKLWLLEGNTSPGLSYSIKDFENGQLNPDYHKDADVTKALLHDSLDLLGLDGHEEGDCKNFWRVC